MSETNEPQSIGNVIAEWLEDAEKKPEEPKPPPKRCAGELDDGTRCNLKLHYFAMFGKWRAPDKCERCDSVERISTRRRLQLLDVELQRANLGPGVSTEPSTRMSAFVDDKRDPFLFVYGDDPAAVGADTQRAVARFVRNEQTKEAPDRALYLPEFILIERLSFSSDYKLEDFIRVDFLAVDQAGAIGLKDWMAQQLYAVLYERRRLGRKTLIAGAKSMKELAADEYPPVLLRLFYDFAGGDRARAHGNLSIHRIENG